MGFSYRKSVRMGPFRVTASKSGVSYSAGVKSARVTRRANGKVQTTLSVPGTETITVHQGGSRIVRKRAGKSLHIAWQELVGIFRTGHVHFIAPGDPLAFTSMGKGLASSLYNPRVDRFINLEAGNYRRLRDLLTGNAPVPPPGSRR